MSIRDIIEAAREVYDKESSLVTTWRSGYKLSAIAVEDFRRTFVPEHVALMEAERVAARELIECAFTAKRGDTSYLDKLHAWAAAGVATDAYRKERGL